MKNLVLLLTGLTFLVGCEETFKGTLVLSESIQLVSPLSKRDQRTLAKCNSRGSKSRKCKKLREKKANNTKTVMSGDHKAKLIPSKKKIKVKILNHKGKTAHEFSVKVPKKVKLPRRNGSIQLDADDTGFTYDIKGQLKTEVTNSDIVYANESCSWTEPHRVCRREWQRIPGCTEGQNAPLAINGKGKGKGDRKRPPKNPGRGKKKCMKKVRVCKTEYVTYYGYQNVEFYNKYTDKLITFSMIKPEQREMVGEFEGTHHASEKIYTYKETCR